MKKIFFSASGICLLIIFCVLIFYGCSQNNNPSSTITITGKIDNGTTGNGPKAKSTKNISATEYNSISDAVSALGTITSCRVDNDGNFTIQLDTSASSSGLSANSSQTTGRLIFSRNGYNTTKESFNIIGTEETIDLGLITLEVDPNSATPPAIPSTSGKIMLLKQTRNPNIPYGDDSGRIGPDPNDIYSARQINSDVNIETNQWYTLSISVTSAEGEARIKAYIDGVLVMDELDPTPYGQAYYSDLRNGNFAIEADAGGSMAYIGIDDVIVTKEGTTVFTDDFESGFDGSSIEGAANWFAMNGDWEISIEASNHYLHGQTETTRYQAYLFYPSTTEATTLTTWVNYSFQYNFKLLTASTELHASLRHRFNYDPSLTGEAYIGTTRYMFSLRSQ